MNENSSRRRQIIFDLDTDVLRQILGCSYRNVYKNIADLFVSYGFLHIQGSGYISNRNISNTEIFDMLAEMKERYPYIDKCFRDIRVADITDINSLNCYFDYDGTPGKYAQNEADSIDEAIHQRRRGR